MNREEILISVQKTKYCSQFSYQCVNVMLEVKIIVQLDTNVFILRHSLYAYASECILKDLS